MKKELQGMIRSFHLSFFDRGLPRQIAFCLHSLEVRHHAAFRECVSALRNEGYSFVNPSQLVQPGPAKRVNISFDDNYKSWFDSLPLFEELNLKVTFYVNTVALRDRVDASAIEVYYDRLQFYGERVPLSTGELRALASAGHTVATHTHSHHILTSLPLAQAKLEIREGKQQLERILGGPVGHFAFPFGMRACFSEELREYCRELGFETVANAIPGRQHRPQTAFDLNRSVWNFERPLEYNLANLRADGALFERLTGRSAVA